MAETAHFRLYSRGPDKRLVERAALLEDYRRLLLSSTGRETVAGAPKLDIYVVDQLADATPFGRPPANAAGYYRAGEGGISAVIEAGDHAQLILLHEYAHHFMLGGSAVAYPPWYVEGFAEYFATATFRPDRIEVGRANANRVSWLLNAPMLPMERLLARAPGPMSPPEAAIFYAQSWLLTHFLFRSPEMRGALTAYLKATAEGADPVTAFQQHVDPDLKGFPARLRRYLQGRDATYSRFQRQPIATADVQLTRLSPAADRMLMQRLALEQGLSPQAAPRALASIRQAAAAHPDDPFARKVAALAEVKLGDRPTADTLVRAQLIDRPDDPDLLRWQAMLLAPSPRRASPEAQAQARKLLARAFRADPQDWRILLHHVRLSRPADQPVEDKVLEAMLRAHELAPQVPEVVLETATLLAQAGQMASAARILEPLAYSPHAGAASKLAAALMQAARRGDAAGVLKVPPLTGDIAPVMP